MQEPLLLAVYQRLANDARARAASAATDYIRRDYLELVAHYEERRSDAGSAHAAASSGS
jgi:hypothetical protein